MRQTFDRESDLYRRDAAGCWFAGYVFGLLSALAIMLAGGCASAQRMPSVPGAIPISVVSWPAPIKPECELSDLPPIPDVFIWTQISEEEAGRIYVTQRALADLVVWFKDVKHHGDLLAKCLGKLTVP